MRHTQLQVIYEDNHLIAINKPAGMLVQGDETGDTPLSDLVKDYIKEKYNKPGKVYLGVLHRIDRPVSGIVLFARNSKTAERMSKKFAERDIQKTYLAIVEGHPEKSEATLIHYLVKNPNTNKVKYFRRPHEGALLAELDYKVVKEKGRFSLLEVHPHTGRPHQIRVQLSAIDCPIAGDVKYGASDGMDNRRIQLHSYRLAFEHPSTKEPVSIEAAAPFTL